MRPELRIRRGARADAPRLAALAIQVFLHTYATQGISAAISDHVLSEFTAAKFRTLLGRESVTVFVAEVNAHLVGYARVDSGAACPGRGVCTTELATLYVQAHFAGQGVGSALLAQARALALLQTKSPLWLTVNAANALAIGFYAKHGFSKIGTSRFVLGNESHENHVLVAGDVQAAAPMEG